MGSFPERHNDSQNNYVILGRGVRKKLLVFGCVKNEKRFKKN